MWISICLCLALLIKTTHVAQSIANDALDVSTLNFEASKAPPKYPPSDLVERFTQEHSIPLEKFYVDDTNKGLGTHYRFSHEVILSYLESAKRQIDYLELRYASTNDDPTANTFPDDNVSDIEIDSLHKKHWPIFGMWRHKRYFKNARVAVFGSVDPYIETIALALGAQSTTTFEFNNLTFQWNHEIFDAESPVGSMDVVCGDAYLTLLTQSEQLPNNMRDVPGNENACEMNESEHCKLPRPYKGPFDIVLSISSFDHSGLGRYGDPLDPDGDLRAMRFVRSVMQQKHSLLFLTVPGT